MRAQDWMVPDVCTCRPETSLDEAAYLMWQGECGFLPEGFLPVVDSDQKLAGMIVPRFVEALASICARHSGAEVLEAGPAPSGARQPAAPVG